MHLVIMYFLELWWLTIEYIYFLVITIITMEKIFTYALGTPLDITICFHYKNGLNIILTILINLIIYLKN